MVQTANALKDGIKPDVMPFVKISDVLIDDKKVIKMWRKPIGLPMGCKPQNFCKKF